jgi:hypothetical protein
MWHGRLRPFVVPEADNPVDFWWCPRQRLSEIAMLPYCVKTVFMHADGGYRHIVETGSNDGKRYFSHVNITVPATALLSD